MENVDEFASGVRVTRSLRKRLNSVESDGSSRPASPLVVKLTTITENKDMSSLSARVSRRNSINTPIKTPSKTKGLRGSTPDIDSPACRTTRRSSLFMAEEEHIAPNRFFSHMDSTKPIIEEPKLDALAEEETKPTALAIQLKHQGVKSPPGSNANIRSAAVPEADNSTAVNEIKSDLIEESTKEQIKPTTPMSEQTNTTAFVVRVKRCTPPSSRSSQELQIDDSHKKAHGTTTRSRRLIDCANNKNSINETINLDSDDETSSNHQLEAPHKQKTPNAKACVVDITADTPKTKVDSIQVHPKNQSVHEEIKRDTTEIATKDITDTENVLCTPVKNNKTTKVVVTEVLCLKNLSIGSTQPVLNKSTVEIDFKPKSPQVVCSKVQSETAKSVTFNESDEEDVIKSTYPKTPIQIKSKNYMNADHSIDSLEQSFQSGISSVASLKKCKGEQETKAEQQEKEHDSPKESIEFHDATIEHSEHDENTDVKQDSFDMDTYTMLPEKTPHKPLTLLAGNRQSSTPIIVENVNSQKIATQPLQMHEEADEQMPDAKMVKEIENNHHSDSANNLKEGPLDVVALTPEKYLRSGKIYGISPPLHSPTLNSQQKIVKSSDCTLGQKRQSPVATDKVTNSPEKSMATDSIDKRVTPTTMNESVTKGQTNSPAKVEITKGFSSTTWCRNISDVKPAKIDDIHIPPHTSELVENCASTKVVEIVEEKSESFMKKHALYDSDNDYTEDDVIDIEQLGKDDVNRFIDDEAMEVDDDYRSGDSIEEEERLQMEENNIEVDGESIGSEDTDEGEVENDEDNYEAAGDKDDSFIADSDKECTSVESSDADTVNDLKKNNNKIVYKRIRLPSSDDDDTDDDNDKPDIDTSAPIRAKEQNDKNEKEKKNGKPDEAFNVDVTMMIDESVMVEEEHNSAKKTTNLLQKQAQEQDFEGVTVVEKANNSLKMKRLSLNKSNSKKFKSAAGNDSAKKLQNVSGNNKLNESALLLRVDSSDDESHKHSAEEDTRNTANTTRKSLNGNVCNDKEFVPDTEKQMSSPTKSKKSLAEKSLTASGNRSVIDLVSGNALRQRSEIYEVSSDDNENEKIACQRTKSFIRKSKSLTQCYNKITTESIPAEVNVAECALFESETKTSTNKKLNLSSTKKCKSFNESLKNRASANKNNEEQATELDENESAIDFVGQRNKKLKRNSLNCSISVEKVTTSKGADVERQKKPLQDQTVTNTSGTEGAAKQETSITMRTKSTSTSKFAAGLSVSFCSMYQSKMTAGMHARGTAHRSFNFGESVSGTKNENEKTDEQAVESEEEIDVEDEDESQSKNGGQEADHDQTDVEVEAKDVDRAINSAEEAGDLAEMTSNGDSNSSADYPLSSDTQKQTSISVEKMQRRQALDKSSVAAAVPGETLSIKKKANYKSTGELCNDDSTQVMDERKPDVQQGVKNTKRKRLSKSFGSSLDATINSTPQGMQHLHKKSKLAKYDALEDLSTAVHSSTPQAKSQRANNDSKNYRQHILERCDEILEAANRAKLEAKINFKKSKVTLPTKINSSSSPKEENEVDPVSPKEKQMEKSHAIGQSVEKKQKERKTKLAVEQALKASANIILNPTGKVKPSKFLLGDEQLPLQTKRLPAHFLEVVSCQDAAMVPNKKKKVQAKEEQEHLGSVHKIHSAAGDVIEEPLSPKCKRKFGTIKLATGTVSVEPLTPKRKNNTSGFRESPITPRTTGFKVRQILTAGQDTPPTLSSSSGLRRKRKRLIIEEPSYTLPKPQWAQSGPSFVQHILPTRVIPAESSTTRFMVAALNGTQKKIKNPKKGIAPNAINASAISFKQNALHHTNAPRESSRAALQRKERQYAYQHF